MMSPEEPSSTNTSTDVVDDPWAVDESAAVGVGGLTEQEQQQLEPPNDTAEAFAKLKSSSTKLATNLDHKLNLSGAWTALSTSVRQLDESTKVSATVQTGVSGIGNWFSTVDQTYQISGKTKEIGSTLGAVLPTEEIKSGLSKGTKALQNFDAEHKITASVSNTLADGAEVLANTIGNNNNDGTTTKTAAAVDQAEDLDQDGLPTSFQK